MVTMGISSSLLSGPAHLSRSFILSCLIALVCPTLAQAQDSPTQDEMTYYFLKDVDYGSQSTFGPLQVILNSGFDILRSGSYPNSLTQIDFATGFVNVWDNMLNPIDNIRATQPWSDFVAHEIFPYKAFNPDHGHFVPNYFLHTIGELSLIHI